MTLAPLAIRIVVATLLLVVGSLIGPIVARAGTGSIWTSLEQPPTPAEIATAFAAGITTFEFDLLHDGATAAAAAIKRGGGRVAAYHVGGGGGRAWGSVRADEQVRAYDDPKQFEALTVEVRRFVAVGATLVHFDNTHRFSGKRLEAIVEAIRAGGAGFVAKNNPEKWRLVMKRRPDLVPAYAVVEDAMFDAGVTQAAYDLHEKGVPVLIVGFKKPVERTGAAVTEEYAAAYKAANPWATVMLVEDEARYDSRTAVFY